LPWWAERQLDPASPAYAPEPSECRYWLEAEQIEANLLANTRGRSWTFIGRPETTDRATVDPRGLFTLMWGAWSLDWWVRTADQWVFPSQAPSVRQGLVRGMPVIETVLTMGGGEVVHRVGAAGDTPPSDYWRTPRPFPWPFGDEAAAVLEVFVVEVTNRTPSPVTVALAVRPCHLGAFEIADADVWEWSNRWTIDQISIDGRVLSINDGVRRGHVLAQVVFDRDPVHVVFGSHGTDGAAALGSADPAVLEDRGLPPLTAGAVADSESETPGPATSVECPQRLANAAATFPLEAGETLRAAVPGTGLAYASSATESRRAATGVLESGLSLQQAARNWHGRLEGACRLDIPSGPLADAAAAAMASQLLATAPCDDGPGLVGPMLWPATYTDAQFDGDDLMQMLGLVESGLPDPVLDLLIRQAAVQHSSGDVSSMGLSVTGTSLVMAEHLLTLHPQRAPAVDLTRFAASAVRWLLSPEAERQEPWTAREGLRAGYRLLRRLGAGDAASELRSAAQSRRHAHSRRSPQFRSSRQSKSWAWRLQEQLRVDPAASPDASSFYLNIRGRPSWRESPRTDLGDSVSWLWDWERRDAGLWMHAAVPWAPPLPFLTADPVEGTPRDFVADVLASRGYDVVATALLAFAEARPAPARAFERLEALVSVASPTLNWPTFMDPRLRTGTNGEGHDLKVGGLLLRTLLRLLVDVPEVAAEQMTPGLRLAGHWPEAWLGKPMEVHGLPTRLGTVSWAVGWRGDRPQLWWDVVAHDPATAAPCVAAPGLDPTFTATAWHGEELLAPPRPSAP
jgi:hypothetical protein